MSSNLPWYVQVLSPHCFELIDKSTLSLEEAGIVEGVSWMNYFLVIFIALPLALLLIVKVTQIDYFLVIFVALPLAFLLIVKVISSYQNMAQYHLIILYHR